MKSEKLKKQQDEWRKSNPDIIKECNKRAYEKDRKLKIEIQKRYRTKNVEKVRERCKEWKKKNRDKLLAHKTLQQAVRRGYIVKPQTCLHCNSSENIEAHHDDYKKRLEIQWVCRRCHRQLDKKRRFLEDKNHKLQQDNKIMRETLEKLRDCDWVITLPDRMDAVRDIVREALKKVGDGWLK